MTKIEFLYNVDDVTNGIKFVLEKFLKKQNIFIFSDEKKEELSSVLWSESNFFTNIIEAELTTNKQPLEKILIGSKFDPHFDQLLINVSRSECLFFSRFLNLIEIVTECKYILRSILRSIAFNPVLPSPSKYHCAHYKNRIQNIRSLFHLYN